MIITHTTNHTGAGPRNLGARARKMEPGLKVPWEYMCLVLTKWPICIMTSLCKSAILWNTVMAALFAMSHAVRVLAPWLDSGETAYRSRTINDVPRPRRRSHANTGSYVHVRCENGPQQRSAAPLRCTEVMETTQNKDWSWLCFLYVYMCTCMPATWVRYITLVLYYSMNT